MKPAEYVRSAAEQKYDDNDRKPVSEAPVVRMIMAAAKIIVFAILIKSVKTVFIQALFEFVAHLIHLQASTIRI